jgi:hypothetical protein
MPARRDILTERLTFLHRSWGPLEPFAGDCRHAAYSVAFAVFST